MPTNRYVLNTLRALAVLLLVGVVGCADGLAGYEEPETSLAEPWPGPKLRHAQLLDRALRHADGAAKSGDGDLYLIVATDEHSTIEKQRVIERFKTLERYRVLERQTYSEVFDGWAWQIEDSLGLADFTVFLALLDTDPDILWYEPDFDVSTPTSSPSGGGGGQQVPWSVALIGGQYSAAQSGDGAGSVPVDLYVLDTGVTNPDLSVVEAMDFREGMADPSDDDGHGTHVAAIAAADDDGDGLVGVAPGAHLHNLKVLDDDGTTDVSVVIAAVEHVLAQKQADPATPIVVNMSLGEDVGTPAYTALDEAIETATAAGVVFVAAAGNHGKDAAHVTPAHVDAVITVGAYDPEFRFSSFSNYGSLVDLMAPGERIVSLAPSTGGAGAPVEMDGTSMAAAHVSGAAALYLWQNPTASPAQVEAALVAAAKPIVQNVPSGTTNRSVWVGTDAVAEVRISDSDDDAEQFADGDRYRNSSDLELAYEGSKAQHIGLRFAGLDIPQGVTITNAYVQFTVDETDGGAASRTIHGQDAATAAAFSETHFDITARPTTPASVAWAPPAWNDVGEAGLDQRTPDLTAIVQEIVARPDWQSGNALALVLSGTGTRTAESYNGSASQAPLLHVEWTPGTEGTHVRDLPLVLERRVEDDNDDAEEFVADEGDMSLGSSDLELTKDDGMAQMVGIRFTGVAIPQGATITKAYVQFTVDETDDDPTSLTIRAQDADMAAAFMGQDKNISDRPTTSASVAWAPPAWDDVGAAGPDQRTPDLKAVVQEVVDRAGWQGQSLVLIIDGTGKRTAESYDGSASKAPLLHVEWEMP